MPRSAFPNCPDLEPVGPLAGRRFMESFCDVTLEGMARGRAGEPPHVVARASSILKERKTGRPATAFPPSVKTSEDRELFRSLLKRASKNSGNRSERHAARLRLQSIFGFDYVKEVESA